MSKSASHLASDRWIGRIIDSRYRIHEPIGRGGMGMVYKVEHTQMGKVAALKLLHQNLARDKDLVKRFQREATSISRLNHPNIVQVFDFGRVDDSMYLVMEYLPGEDLAHLLRRQGPVPVQRCLPILTQICDALSEAHHQQVIHRDLKPENVRIRRTRDGSEIVKVLDFGLAKILDETDTDSAVTERGSVMGTPYYMAPEVIRAKRMDGRLDIYSLGAVAYRMLTGVSAFVGKSPMVVLTKHLNEKLIPPSERAPDRLIPPELDSIVMRAMEKDVDRRYQTAGELKRDLMSLLRTLDGEMSWPSWTPTPMVRPPTGPHAHQPAVDFQPYGATPSDSPVPDRLSREDLKFERKLNRGRYMLWLIMLPVLCLIGAGVYWFALHKEEVLAPTVEVEPNNTPEAATKLLPDSVISGQLGRRISSRESDRDWYRIEVRGVGPQALRARLTPVPNMDVTLELFDATGGHITGSDSSARGGGEAISQWVVTPGGFFLLVREVWEDGATPTENVTDSYTLSAQWAPFNREQWELEPNDDHLKAHPLTAGASISGFIGGSRDQDCYKVTSAAAGTLSGEVSGPAGVNLAISLRRKPADKPKIVDSAGTSEGEKFSGIKLKKGKVLLLCLRRNAIKKPPVGQTTPGMEQPYELKTTLSR